MVSSTGKETPVAAGVSDDDEPPLEDELPLDLLDEDEFRLEDELPLDLLDEDGSVDLELLELEDEEDE